ncbi:hypothetical protein PC120_g1092 [Phytophthora cactorum]|nr:hypothetical protein PC120_g1092 [Phytophthora cactorum]KAG3102961.1 hypothetical protein PC122_g2016 [Phytophthora cactorum]
MPAINAFAVGLTAPSTNSLMCPTLDFNVKRAWHEASEQHWGDATIDVRSCCWADLPPSTTSGIQIPTTLAADYM